MPEEPWLLGACAAAATIAAAYALHRRRRSGTVAGLSAERLQRITERVEWEVAQRRAPFMQFVLARGGKVVHTVQAGYADLERCTPLRDDTLIRIYSMTKIIVSVGAMMLVERALLHLDCPVEDYLPCFKGVRVLSRVVPVGTELLPDEHLAHRIEHDGVAQLVLTRPCKVKMTVQHLLSHASGLTYDFMPGPVAKLYASHGLSLTPKSGMSAAQADNSELPGALMRWAEKLASLPLVCEPGSAFNYSVGLDVAGLLIEVVSGKLLPDFLQDEILGPLGMVDTAFHVGEADVGRLSACYRLAGESAGGGAGGGAFALLEDPRESMWRVPRRHKTSGGGGLLSTAHDFTRFMLMLTNKGALDGTRILGRKAVEYMMTNQLRPGVLVQNGFLHARGGVGFGIGGSVTVDVAANACPGSLQQFSWGGAANCYMNIDAGEGLCFLLMTQVVPSVQLCQWRRDFQALVQACLVD